MSLLPDFIVRRISHRRNLVAIAENISWLFIDKILRMGVGLLIGVWMARYLGPEQFGLLNFAIALVGLFGAIASLGLQGVVVRDIVRYPDTSHITLGSAAVLHLAGGLVAFLLVLGAIAYLRPYDVLSRTLVAILGGSLLFKVSEVAVYWFESIVQSKYTVWVKNGVFLVFAAINVYLILNKASLVAFVWAMLVEAALVAVVLTAIMNRYGKHLTSLKASVGRIKAMLKDSWPLLLSGIVLMIQARIDQIMLGEMVGDSEVGYYSAALRIVEAAAVTSTILYSSFMPIMVRTKINSEKLYNQRLENFYKLNALSAIAIAVPLVIFSSSIIQFLYGELYMPAASIMVAMVARLFFTHMGMARNVYIINENLLMFSALTMLTGTVVNIIFNFMLIPLYQGIGAAVATLISFLVTIFLVDLIYVKTRNNAKLMITSTITCISLLRNPGSGLKSDC